MRAVTMDAPAIDPYRGIPDDQPLELARAARFDEVARLGTMRRTRHDQSVVTAGIVGFIVLVVVVVAVANAR